MKKNIFKSLLLTAVVSTVGIGSVFAATDDTDYETQSTNINDYKVKMIIENKEDVIASATLQIEGIKTQKLDMNYYYKFVKADTPKPAEIVKSTLVSGTDSMNDTVDGYKMLRETTDGKAADTLQNLAFLYKDYEYIYIYNCTKRQDYTSYCKVTTDKPIKVEKDAIPNLTKRYKATFFGDSSSSDKSIDNKLTIFPLFPYPSKEKENIILNVKIGLIEDSSIIKALARNEAGAAEKLYNYGKNATNGILVSSTLDDFYQVSTDKLTVQNGKYYYMYFEVENPNNKYIDMSDVAIVMGEYDMLTIDIKYGDYESTEFKDYDYGCYACTNDYVWTVKGYQASTCQLVDSITSKGNCVKSVKTGVEDYLVPGAIVMVVGGSLVALLSKKSKFKRI